MNRRELITGASALGLYAGLQGRAEAIKFNEPQGRAILGRESNPNVANLLAAQMAAFPGVVAFWSADRGVTQSGGVVSAVKDQSPNGYNLAANVGSTAWSTSGLNGGPSFNFDDTMNMTATGLTLASRSYSVFAFFQAPAIQATGFGRLMGMICSGQSSDNVGASACIYTNNNPNSFQYGMYAGPNGSQNAGYGNAYFASQTPNVPTILGWVSGGSGQGCNQYNNGAVVGNATTNNGPVGNSPNTIFVGGGKVSGSYFNWTGNLGFLIIASVALTAQQIAIINQFADAAWGTGFAGNNGRYKNLVFTDSFASSSTVDYGNTRLPGKKWYMGPNGAPVPGGNILSFLSTLQATPDASVVVASNQLVLSNTAGAPSYGTCLTTATWDGSKLVGNLFGGGFFIDVVMSFDPTKTGTNNSIFWPAIWLVPDKLLNNTIGARNWVEADIMEYFVSGGALGMTMHDEGGSNVNNQNLQGITYELPGGGTFDFTQPHHYQMLWVPASKNGGKGLWVNYIDGVQMRWQTYSAAGAPLPVLSPTNSVGALSEGDNDSYVLFIDPGTYGPPSQPVTVYSAEVYQ